MATELILVRHAETDWNKDKRFQGQEDPTLNETGCKQADKLAKYLADWDIDIIYTSDLKRAFTTAEAINRYHDIQVIRENGLREIDFGKWEGLTYQEISSEYPEIVKKWNQDPASVNPPGGENLNDFRDRVGSAFTDIINNNENQTILTVSHGGTIKAYLTYLLDMPVQRYWQFETASTGISIIKFFEGKAIISSLNVLAE